VELSKERGMTRPLVAYRKMNLSRVQDARINLSYFWILFDLLLLLLPLPMSSTMHS